MSKADQQPVDDDLPVDVYCLFERVRHAIGEQIQFAAVPLFPRLHDCDRRFDGVTCGAMTELRLAIVDAVESEIREWSREMAKPSGEQGA